MMFLREVPSTDALYRAEHATAPGHRLLVNAFLQDIQTLFLSASGTSSTISAAGVPGRAER